MTKIEMLEAIKSFIPADNQELIDFCDKQISQTIKKNSYVSNKPTAKQVENESLKRAIMATMGYHDKPMTLKDIWDNTAELCAIGNMTTQRISALLTQLVNSNNIRRNYNGKTATFSVVWDEAE